MARKSERNKSKKSPDKSPRRAGRPSKKQRKSESESSGDESKNKREKGHSKDAETAPTAQTSETSGAGEVSERSRRSSRRAQVGSTPAAEKPPATVEEWVEDKQFWGAEENPKEETTTTSEVSGAPDETATEEGGEWKVQTSNGKGGVIQKLRICRTRLTGSESASELSPSPGKESPVPKSKKGKDGNEEGEATESSESSEQPRLRLKLKAVRNRNTPEPEHEIVRSSSQEETPAPNEKEAAPDSHTKSRVIVEQVADISVTESEDGHEKKVEDLRDAELAAAVSSIIGVEPSFPVAKSEKNDDGSKNETSHTETDKESSQQESPAETIQSVSENAEKKTKDIVVPSDKKAHPENKKDKGGEDGSKEETEEAIDADDLDTVSRRSSEDAGDEGVEINISPEEIEAATGGLDETTPIRPRRGLPRPAVVGSKKLSQETKKSHPEESGTKKKDGEKEGKISLKRPSTSEEEVPVKKSKEEEVKPPVEDDQKEEGELDEEQTSKRIVRTNRSLSTTSTTSQDSSTSGTAKSQATTAKKHPLITGPDPDSEVKIKRQRKISVLNTSPAPRTSGGRLVRSIAGDALKAILPAVTAENEKKESEKQAARDKILKVRSEKQQLTSKTSPDVAIVKTSKSLPKFTDIDENMKVVVRVMDDVREVVNRLKDEKKEEKEKKSKSNSENLEPKSSKDSVTKEKKREEKEHKSKMNSENSEPNVVKVVRKVVVASAEEAREVKAAKPVRAASPGDSAATPILFVTNLVRPFTAPQLRDLLARTGTIAQDGFFIDKIKSKCYVKFTDVEMAIETRHALDGVRWPLSNPKSLKVRYVSESEMDSAISNADSDQWVSGHALANNHISRVSVGGVREWDMGKTGIQEEETPAGKYSEGRELRWEVNVRMDEPRREDIRKEEPRKLDKRQELNQRKRPFSPEKPTQAEPARKFKKKGHDAPAKLLDDLFKRTKATPCLYWLPLSSAQIAINEGIRQKHMAEHKRRLAELAKIDNARREKVRERRRK